MTSNRTQPQVKEVLNLVAKEWEIINALSKKEYYGQELAKKVDKTRPEISLKIKNLREKGLVEALQKQGNRRKTFSLSALGKRIFRAVTEAMQSEPDGKLEDWQISQLLEILSNSDLSKEVRRAYSGVFHTLSTESPAQLIEHPGIRNLIKKIVTDAPTDEIDPDLARSVPALLAHASQHQRHREWVSGKLYPILVRKIEAKDEKTRRRAIMQIVEIAALGKDVKLMFDVREKLLKIWFSEKTDASSDLGNEVKEQLVLLALHASHSHAQQILKKTQTKARDKNPQTVKKAEKLLEALKVCLLPKHGLTELDRNSTKKEAAEELGKYTKASN